MKHFSKPSVESIIFYGFLIVALIPIWSQRFFVTGDGPCHVYNSRVLLDFFLDKHYNFYSPFYTLNRNFDPNWLGHLWLAFFQQSGFAPEMSEKLFLTGYILLFAFGLRFILSQINKESIFLSSIGLLFAWHHLLQQGFYNYSISVALFFWVCGFWLKYRNNMDINKSLVFSILWLVIYSAHPLGVAFSAIFIASSIIIAGVEVSFKENFMSGFTKFFNYAKYAVLSMLPMLGLFSEYLYRKPASHGENGETFEKVLADISRLRALITLNSTERDIAKFVGILIVLIAIGAVALRIFRKKWIFEDFILMFAVAAIWQYFRQAGEHSIELLMPLRIQIFPWLALLFWAATASYPKWIKFSILTSGAIITLAFLYIRLPIHQKASELATEYIDCVPYIKDESVILVLNYDFGGKDFTGKEIANRTWLNIHATDYIGAYRTAIMSDNYEALRPYFPMNWRWQRNMFEQTNKDGINFENQPPRADILNFNRRTGGYNIDYVLIANYDDKFKDHDYTKEIQSQLSDHYTLVYTSPKGKALLYALKK